MKFDSLESLEQKVLEILINSSEKFGILILKQLTNSEIKQEKEKYYSLSFFDVSRSVERLPNNGKNGIVLELIVHDGRFPTDVLLHSKDGYITELEIYNADSSEINYDMQLTSYEVINNIG